MQRLNGRSGIYGFVHPCQPCAQYHTDGNGRSPGAVTLEKVANHTPKLVTFFPPASELPGKPEVNTAHLLLQNNARNRALRCVNYPLNEVLGFFPRRASL